MLERMQLTKEEIRDLFPLENIKAFKRLKCFNKLLDEITKYVNTKVKTTYNLKVVFLSKAINLGPSDILMHSFYWKDSIFGEEYWNDIHSKLLNIN